MEIENDLEEMMQKEEAAMKALKAKEKTLNVTPLNTHTSSAKRGRPRRLTIVDDATQFERLSDDHMPDDQKAIPLMMRAFNEVLPGGTVLTNEKLADWVRTIGFQLSYNVVLMQVELYGQAVSENIQGKIQGAFATMSQLVPEPYKPTFRNRSRIKDVFMDCVYDNQVDPIKEYFSWLRPQDLTYSPFERLCEYFADEHKVFGPFLRKFLLGCVAREFDGFQNYTLVLEGGQGLGKSTFVKWLGSFLPRDYYQEGMIIPTDKDHRLRLMRKFLWSVNEFGGSTGKAGQDAIKEFLSSEDISERPAYGHYTVTSRRRCNIVATANEKQLLKDPTGNRRYLIANMTRISHGYREAIDLNDLWAEVYGWYLAGESAHLTRTEKAQQTVTNELAEMDDDVEEYLREELTLAPGHFMSNKTLNAKVALHYQARSAKERNYYRAKVREVMRKWKVEEHRKNTARGFLGVKFSRD